MADEIQYTKQELIEKLTEKEKNFCHEYVVDWNGARSARAAGYSENSSRQIATATLSKVYIQQYIEFIKNDYEKECGVSKIKQLNELSKIAYSDIALIHDNWIDLTDWEEIKRNNPNITSAIESIDTKTETKVYKTDGDDETDVEIKYIKVKFFSKLQAIQEINKMMGYNEAEKHDHTTKGKSLNPVIKLNLEGKDIELK
jgi:phage terminase small subunit